MHDKVDNHMYTMDSWS